MARRKINNLTPIDNIVYFSRNIKISTILRDKNIAKARDDGFALDEIAKAAGMSLDRIKRILAKEDGIK